MENKIAWFLQPLARLVLLTSQIFFSDIITVLLSTSKTNSTRVSAALLEQQCKSQILKKTQQIKYDVMYYYVCIIYTMFIFDFQISQLLLIPVH